MMTRAARARALDFVALNDHDRFIPSSGAAHDRIPTSHPEDGRAAHDQRHADHGRAGSGPKIQLEALAAQGFAAQEALLTPPFSTTRP